ncbi:MAG: hypothetical protein AAFU68_12000, partial [Pseudomonadota bacterium]
FGIVSAMISILYGYLGQRTVSESLNASAEKIFWSEYKDHNHFVEKMARDENKAFPKAKNRILIAVVFAVVSIILFSFGSGFGIYALSNA